MKAKEVLSKYKISRVTLYKWVKKGKIKYKLTPSGQYDYLCEDELTEISTKIQRKTIIYARVST